MVSAVAREGSAPRARLHRLQKASYVICDLEEVGFPVRYISPGYADLFGCTVAHCVGKTCGVVIGIPGIKARDPELLGPAALTGMRGEALDVSLDALSGLVRGEVQRMLAGETGFALLVNQRRSGELFTIALILRAYKQSTDSRSFCVGFQFDITDALPVKELLMATLSSGMADLRARHWRSFEPWVAYLAREDVAHLLHQQADDTCRMVALQLLRGVGREELSALDEEVDDAQALENGWTPSLSTSTMSPEMGLHTPGSPRSPTSLHTSCPDRRPSTSQPLLKSWRSDLVGLAMSQPHPIQWPQDEPPGVSTPRSDASGASTSSLLSRRSAKLKALSVGTASSRKDKGYRHLLAMDGYVLGSVLGRSCNRGFSVLAARRNEQVFAAKCTDEARQEGILVLVLRREYETLRRLHHPNVVRAVHFLEEHLGAALVMEHCPGMRLDIVVRLEGRLSVGQRRQVSKQVLSALAYLHENGIAHRDLHAENVMVDVHSQLGADSLVVKLLDFGSVHTSGSEWVIPDDNVNTRILPPSGLEGDAFAGDVFAAGLLVLSVAIMRVVVTEDILQAGALALPRPGECEYIPVFEQYLQSLLNFEPAARATAQVAHDSLPALELWCDPRGQPEIFMQRRASGSLKNVREAAGTKLSL